MLAFILLNLIAFCMAGIADFTGETISLTSYAGSSSSMYTKTNTPLGSDESYMEFDIKGSGNATKFFALFFHESQLSNFSQKVDGNTYVCCTPEVRAEDNGLPCELNTPLAYRQNGNNFTTWEIDVDNAENSPFAYSRVNVTEETGYYYFVAVSCEPDATVTLSGTVTWRNPYGYLACSLMPYMMIYMFLACAYFVLFAFYTGLVLFYRRVAVRIQWAIVVVLGLSFVENLIYSIDWGVYNYNTGYISLAWNITTVIIYAIRTTLSWLLLLLVAMGLDLYRRSLRKYMVVVIAYVTIISFVVTQVYESVAMLRYTPSVSHLAVPTWIEYFLLVLVTMIDFAIAMWIGFELYRSTLILKKYQQWEKLALFKKLIYVIGFVIGIAVILFLVEFIAEASGTRRKIWHVSAMFGASWPVLFLLVKCGICYLFKPTQRNAVLSMVQLADDGEEAEMQSTRPGSDSEDERDFIDEEEPAAKAVSSSEDASTTSELEEEEEEEESSSKS